MRWDGLRDRPGAGGEQALAVPALFDAPDVVTRADTPGFRGITFFEIRARSVINKVPAASRVPFSWTINPYRGCSHACVYCFARGTHKYLDLDAGLDFNSKIIVKVNAAEAARRELASPRWSGEPIAIGANVDCYQRAEGRYQLMPGILAALRDAANPFSILTKGTLILRDLDLIAEAAEVTDVGLNVSAGFVDQDLWRSVEPGTPSPQRRLEVCAALTARGLRCGVLMGPILPFLTDSPDQLAATVRLAAEAGAAHVAPIVLHLRPGAREWFMAWLAREHPALVPRYRGLYGNGSYAPRRYQQQISDHVRELAARYGVGRASPAAARRTGPAAADRGPRPRTGLGGGARPAAQASSSADPGVQLSLI
jgi:DNA repair photolyase